MTLSIFSDGVFHVFRAVTSLAGPDTRLEVMLNPSAAKESVAWLRKQVGREAASRVVEDFIKETDLDGSTITAVRRALETE